MVCPDVGRGPGERDGDGQPVAVGDVRLVLGIEDHLRHLRDLPGRDVAAGIVGLVADRPHGDGGIGLGIPTLPVGIDLVEDLLDVLELGGVGVRVEREGHRQVVDVIGERDGHAYAIFTGVREERRVVALGVPVVEVQHVDADRIVFLLRSPRPLTSLPFFVLKPGMFFCELHIGVNALFQKSES